MSPIDACVDAARWHGRISVQTARADARLLQDAHNKSSSTYVLPAYVKNHQKKKLEELPKREPKGKCAQETKAVTNIPRVLRGERSSAEFL